MVIGSGAWMSRQKNEEKEIQCPHYMSVPLKFIILTLPYKSGMSRRIIAIVKAK
jgi:hypothetical protein